MFLKGIGECMTFLAFKKREGVPQVHDSSDFVLLFSQGLMSQQTLESLNLYPSLSSGIFHLSCYFTFSPAAFLIVRLLKMICRYPFTCAYIPR